MGELSAAKQVSARLYVREVPLRVVPDTAPPRRRLADVVAEIRPQSRSLVARAAKRAIDVAGAAFGLIALSPVLLVVALLVKATSRGPAVFVQKRCGFRGRVFNFYKFRTMVEDAEKKKADIAHLNEMKGPIFKIRRDPRITRLGALLRKLSVDELPQLWNVLKGDMSLVGPRPPLLEEVELYNSRQVQRLSVLPGITGLWQVNGRSAISDFDQWLELDLQYVQRWSVWLDMSILLKTVLVVLSTNGSQ